MSSHAASKGADLLKGAAKSCRVTFKEDLLNRLQSLLDEVSRELVAPSAVNACGSCNSCCTAKGLNVHKVTEMEFALLAERVSPQVSQNFRDYIDRKTDASGALLHEVCPNSNGGCAVYVHRPFSCRVFGHVREENTGFPPNCVYTGHEKVTRKAEYFRAIPGAAAMRVLWREFQLLVALPPRHGETTHEQLTETDGTLFVNYDDPLDRTLQHIARQRFEQAMEELAALDPSTESPARTELWGLALAAVGQHEMALAKYQKLLSQVPPRADFLYHAGTAAFQIGDVGLAERYWKQSCELSPLYSPSLGMLGYLAHILKNWQEAASYFSRALEEDGGNPFFHLRLAESYCNDERPHLARAHIELALSHPATHEAALALVA